MVRLHVLSEGVLQASFCLSEGCQWLGSGPRADLPLKASLAPPLLCRIDLTPSGAVVARVEELQQDTTLRLSDGTIADVLLIPNGDFAELAGLRLLVLAQPEPRDVQARLRSSTDSRAPGTPGPPLALRIRIGNATKIVVLGDALELRIGRDPENDLVLQHPDIARHHARLQRRPEGLWLEDLGSARGLTIDGQRIRSAPLPLGASVGLSGAGDSPVLAVIPEEEVLPELFEELVSPLRGQSEAIRQVRAGVARLGPSDEPVLITGEPGTGKGVVARALARVRDARIPLGADCSALPIDVLESVLFGFRRGAFPGAEQEHVGCLEAAGGATVFLDEIGDLPGDLQPRLFQALQTKAIVRRGEKRSRDAVFRLIATTRHDLDELATQGQFDPELNRALSGAILRLPPLRQHKGDIGDLARAALRSLEGPSGGKSLSHGALDRLRHHEWPDNVRELLASVRMAALATDELEIPMEALVLSPPGMREPSSRHVWNLPAHLESLEQAHSLRVFIGAHGDVPEAARQLGLHVTQLRRRLERWQHTSARRAQSEPRRMH